MITAIGRVPVERSTDYRARRQIDPEDGPHGPVLGPRADGTPLLPKSAGGAGGDPASADD